MARLPLEGIRVVDSTYVIAMPYACGMMADLGADVIKIEGPAHSDTTRYGQTGSYPDNDPGEDPWNRSGNFTQINRGKRSLTLDLSQEEGREVLKDLLKVADVFVENYTPRVMRRWGLDYPNLKKIKPDIIMLSNTGYGHGEGPYSTYPAMATSMEGTHGQVSISGYPDQPSKVGRSFVDFVACWSALLGTATALHHRNRTGAGQWIDLGMYQAGCFFLGEYILDWQANGRLPVRRGNRHPSRAPQGCYRCAGDDAWCAISVGDDEEWKSLCGVMGKPELASEPRFATALDRMKYHDEIDGVIGTWIKGVSKMEAMERLQGAGVPAGSVFDTRDTALSEHYRETGFLEHVQFPDARKVGTRVIMGRPWRGSKVPLKVKGPAPKLGEHNQNALLELLAYDQHRYEELEKSGIIGDRPANPRPVPTTTLDDQVERGLLAYHDPDYKAKLGI